MSVKWNDEMVGRLKSLAIRGMVNQEISQILSEEFGKDIDWKAVDNARSRFDVMRHCMEIDKDIKIYKELTLPMGPYAIFCDPHSPYHSELWVNRLLSIADKFLPKDEPKKCICIGDLFDMNFAKKWYSDEPSSLDDEIFHVEPIIRALDYFDEVVLVTGNHEQRIGRLTDAKIQARHLYRLFGKEIWDRKFKVTEYDKLRIGDEWLLVHPQSYSQISPAVAKRLAEKFHCNIINSHGHLVGSGWERSGRYEAIDLGGMFDIRKIEYINMKTTTHPVWKNGFGMLRNGKFWHFTDATDWEYWAT